MRTPSPTCDDRIQQKRPAPENSLDERVNKCLKSVANTDCLSVDPLDAASKQGDTGLVPQEPIKDADTPLTEQALRQINKSNRPYSSEASPPMTLETHSESSMNSGLSDEPEDAINADHPAYSGGLHERGIDFADDEPDKDPSNIQELMKAVSAERLNYVVPSGTAARNLRIRARKACNESAMVQSILPGFVPLTELEEANDISTTPDQKWHRMVMIRPDEPQLLRAPKPDRTIGWSQSVFRNYRKAMRRLGILTCPVAENHELAIPLFTIEVDRSLKVAKLQNLHNGATMLANLLDIWKLGLGENTDGFFDKVHAMSLELTKETIQLSYYWARKENGEIKFYGRFLNGWSLYDGYRYKKAHRYIRNALEWVREQALKWVCPALSALENKLNTESLPPMTPRTPPNQASGKRTRSVTSVSSSASTPVKKKGATETRKALSVGKRGAGEEEAREDEASEDEASEDEAREDEASEDEASEGEASEDEASQDEASQDEAEPLSEKFSV